MPSSAPLTEAVSQFRRAAGEISATYERRKPAASNQVTPDQLIEAIEQFLAVATRLDREEGETGPIVKDDVDQLGEYGLNMLLDLATWARQLELDEACLAVQGVSLAAADWIIRHEGRIHTLEPMVNAFADVANRTQDPKALEQMAGFMGAVIAACGTLIQQDLEKTNPGRPWRLLHLNRGIVATRSHNTALMEAVFDQLVAALPDDAAAFFQQGMQQMVALHYPEPVRAVMSRYHEVWSKRRVH